MKSLKPRVELVVGMAAAVALVIGFATQAWSGAGIAKAAVALKDGVQQAVQQASGSVKLAGEGCDKKEGGCPKKGSAASFHDFVASHVGFAVEQSAGDVVLAGEGCDKEGGCPKKGKAAGAVGESTGSDDTALVVASASPVK